MQTSNFYFLKIEEEKSNNAIDEKSIKGIFGWDTVNDIPLPIIFRDDEKLVAVRIVESKVLLIPNLKICIC